MTFAISVILLRAEGRGFSAGYGIDAMDPAAGDRLSAQFKKVREERSS
jgi:enoyl-CoA hydratase/carnithine racemase